MGASDSFLTLDPNLTIVAWTSGVQDLFGYEPAEILGRPVFVLVPEDQRAAVVDVMRRLEVEGRVDGFRAERLTKRGERVRVVADLLAVRDAAGERRATQITVRRA